MGDERASVEGSETQKRLLADRSNLNGSRKLDMFMVLIVVSHILFGIIRRCNEIHLKLVLVEATLNKSMPLNIVHI